MNEYIDLGVRVTSLEDRLNKLEGISEDNFTNVIQHYNAISYYNAKMYLFGKWIAMKYADIHVDVRGKHAEDEGFKSSLAISILNAEDGFWWAKQLNEYNTSIYLDDVKSGKLKSTIDFLSE